MFEVSIKLTDGSQVGAVFPTPAEAHFHMNLYAKNGYVFAEEDGTAQFIPPQQFVTLRVVPLEYDEDDELTDKQLAAKYFL